MNNVVGLAATACVGVAVGYTIAAIGEIASHINMRSFTKPRSITTDFGVDADVNNNLFTMHSLKFKCDSEKNVIEVTLDKDSFYRRIEETYLRERWHMRPVYRDLSKSNVEVWQSPHTDTILVVHQ